MSNDAHQRAPESLAKEIWFYSLERRAQSAVLRKTVVGLTAAAVVFALVATMQVVAVAGALAALAAAVVLETGALLRARYQKRSVLAQLQGGANTQLVDAAGSPYSTRSLLVVALVVAVAVGIAGLLIMSRIA